MEYILWEYILEISRIFKSQGKIILNWVIARIDYPCRIYPDILNQGYILLRVWLYPSSSLKSVSSSLRTTVPDNKEGLISLNLFWTSCCVDRSVMCLKIKIMAGLSLSTEWNAVWSYIYETRWYLCIAWIIMSSLSGVFNISCLYPRQRAKDAQVINWFGICSNI